MDATITASPSCGRISPRIRRIIVVFPSPEGPTSATISPGHALKYESVITLVPSTYAKFTSFISTSNPSSANGSSSSLSLICTSFGSSTSSRILCADTELFRNDGMIDTTLLNAPDRLLLCCRNNVIVPYVIVCVHSKNRQYPNAMNSTPVPITDNKILVLMENILYSRLTSLNLPCHQRINRL